MRPLTVVIFGATGHLATQRLFPALAASETFATSSFIAVGRSSHTDASFRELLAKELCPPAFANKIRYIQADATNSEGYTAVAEVVGSGDRMLYCSVPPTAIPAVVEAIAAAELNAPTSGKAKIIIEKPFGSDRTTATTLCKRLAELFHETDIYPLDHYLAKETVENLLAFRFGNALFEPLWSAEHIREIQITVAESEGVEDRLQSYTGVGAVRDLLQNHALQLLALLLMDEPEVCKPEPLSRAKEELLCHIRVSPKHVVLGQYEADSQVLEKLDTTETYAAAVLHVDTPRWRTVPIGIRTGKKLADDVTDITVHFRKNASSLFGNKGHANHLTFRVQPDESIFLSLAVKKPGEQFHLQTTRMTFCYHDAFRSKLGDAYQRALEAIALGDRSVAASVGFIQEAWRIIEEMQTPTLPVHRYAPGSWGPALANSLLPNESEWTVTEGDVCNGVTLTK